MPSVVGARRLPAIVRLVVVVLAIVGVIAVCFILNEQVTSTMSDPQTGLSVSVGQPFLGNRTLRIVAAVNERVQTDLVAEWGPNLRTNLYRTATGGLAVLDFAGSWIVLQSPLRLEPAVPADDWEYLGTLIGRRFESASQAPECMDILMNEPPPPQRSWVYRQSC